jgi:hypothetical protein
MAVQPPTLADEDTLASALWQAWSDDADEAETPKPDDPLLPTIWNRVKQAAVAQTQRRRVPPLAAGSKAAQQVTGAKGALAQRLRQPKRRAAPPTLQTDFGGGGGYQAAQTEPGTLTLRTWRPEWTPTPPLRRTVRDLYRQKASSNG